MMFGFTPQEFEFLNKNLVLPLKKYGARVFIFGSRAKNTYSKFSDVDIFYQCEPSIPSTLISEIEVLFEDSNFPYKLDLVNYKEIAKSYLPGIEKDKQEL